jgi:hypothetical protein
MLQIFEFKDHGQNKIMVIDSVGVPFMPAIPDTPENRILAQGVINQHCNSCGD